MNQKQHKKIRQLVRRKQRAVEEYIMNQWSKHLKPKPRFIPQLIRQWFLFKFIFEVDRNELLKIRD